MKMKNNKSAPWYSENAHTIKQSTQKLVQKWWFSQLKVFCLAWKDGLLEYKHALIGVRSACLSDLIRDNMHNNIFLLMPLLDSQCLGVLQL